tara:strand:- start:2672 stop:6763 length:4092 start_codon:yes stop_codon:yes gene_type:complete
MDFKTQISNLIGSNVVPLPSDNALTQWLRDGVIDVINKIKDLNPGELSKFVNTISDDSNDGITLTGKIYSVVREHDSASILRECTPIPAESRYDASDVDSLRYRSKFNPAYYVLDKKIYSIPASAGSNNALKVSQVHYDETITQGSDDMQHFPREYIRLVPLFAACRAIESQLASLKAEPDNIINISTPPDEIILSAITETLPVFLSPNPLNLPSDLAYTNIDFSGLSQYPDYITPNLVIDSFPAISWSPAVSLNAPILEALEDWLTGNTFIEDGLLPSEPIYTSPSITLTSPPTISSLSLSTASITVNDNISVDDIVYGHVPPSFIEPAMNTVAYPSIVWKNFNIPIAPILNTTAISFSTSAPGYTKPTISLASVPSIASLILPESSIANMQISSAAINFTSAAPLYIQPDLSMTSMPNISSLVVGATAPTVPSVSDSSVSFTEPAPTYVSPTLTYTAFPSDIEWSMPAIPMAPILDMSPVTQALHEIAMPADAVLPDVAFSEPPALEWSFPADPMPPRLDWSGITQSIDAIQLPADVVLPTMISIPDPPTVTYNFPAQPLMKNIDWGDLENWITVEEDAEMAAARINAAQVQASTYRDQVQGYSAEIEAQLTKNRGLIENWAAEQNSRVQVFSSSMQALSAKYRDESQGKQSIVNAQVATLNAQVQKVVQTNQAEIANFQAVVQGFTSKISATVNKNQALLSAWGNEMNVRLQKYTAVVQAQVQLNAGNVEKNKEEYQQKLQIRQAQLAEVQTIVNAESTAYQSQIQAYQAQINATLQKNSTKVDAWNKENTLYFNKYQVEGTDLLNRFNTENTEYQAKLQIAIQNAQLSSQDDVQKIQKFQAEVAKYQADVNKEIEVWQANTQTELTKWTTARQTELQKYQSDIQNNLNDFNKNNVVYQADLQVATQEAQLSDNSNVHEIQRYQNRVQKYQADVNSKVQEWQLSYTKDLELWRAERNTQLQQYQSDIQNEVSEFNKENAAYQAQLQISLQQAQLDNQVEIQEIQKFQSEVQAYQTAVTSHINENSAKIKEWVDREALEMQRYGAKVQAETQKFNAENVAYQAQLQVSIENQNLGLEKQSVNSQRIQSKIQDRQNDINQKVQEYQQNLTKELELWTRENNNKLQVYTAEIQDAQSKYQRDNAVYAAKMQKILKNAELHSKREGDKINLDSLEIQKFQAEIQDNTAKINNEVQQNNAKIQEWVSLHNVRIQEFQTKVQAESEKTQIKVNNYKDTLMKALETYKSETGADIAELQANVQKELGRFSSELQEKTQAFNSNMQKYQGDLSNITQVNQSKIAKYQAEIVKYQTDSNQYLQEFGLKMQATQADYQFIAGRLVQLKGEYNGAFVTMAPKQVQQQQQKQ